MNQTVSRWFAVRNSRNTVPGAPRINFGSHNVKYYFAHIKSDMQDTIILFSKKAAAIVLFFVGYGVLYLTIVSYHCLYFFRDKRMGRIVFGVSALWQAYTVWS